MKRLFKILVASSLALTLFAFVGFISSVHAEEVTETTPVTTTTEVVETTEATETTTTTEVEATEKTETETAAIDSETKSKIDDIIDFVQSLNEDELMELLNQAKGWVISIGVVGIVTILTAFIGLIAALTKLKNEKIRNSQLTEEAKAEKIADNEKTQETIIKQVNSVKLLLLEFVNGLSDEDKKKVESNIASVKARILELQEETKE